MLGGTKNRPRTSEQPTPRVRRRELARCALGPGAPTQQSRYRRRRLVALVGWRRAARGPPAGEWRPAIRRFGTWRRPPTSVAASDRRRWRRGRLHAERVARSVAPPLGPPR